jgi:hypothetical protein
MPASFPVLRGLQVLALLPLLLTLSPARADRAAPRANYKQALKYSVPTAKYPGFPGVFAFGGPPLTPVDCSGRVSAGVRWE